MERILCLWHIEGVWGVWHPSGHAFPVALTDDVDVPVEDAGGGAGARDEHARHLDPLIGARVVTLHEVDPVPVLQHRPAYSERHHCT